MYGRPVQHRGDMGVFRGTEIPLELIKNMGMPIPITISGTNNVIFTLEGGTRPIAVWAGNDLFYLREDLAYTWGSATNTVLQSDGTTTTQTGSTAGVWYYYVGIDTSTTPPTARLYPSQTAPDFADDRWDAGYLSHPGASRAQYWRYVGWQACTTATTPAFMAATKVGWEYHFAGTSKATATTWAELDFSAKVPVLEKFGGLAQGYVETGADGTIYIGSLSSSTQGIRRFESPASGTTVSVTAFGGLFEIPMTSNGKIYARHATAAGDVHVTGVRDVV